MSDLTDMEFPGVKHLKEENQRLKNENDRLRDRIKAVARALGIWDGRHVCPKCHKEFPSTVYSCPDCPGNPSLGPWP